MNWLTEFLDTTIVTALGKMIMHSLWQASIIAFLLAIVLKSLPERLSHLRHEISGFALFMVLIVSLCTFLIFLKEPTKTVTFTGTLIADNLTSIVKDPSPMQTSIFYAVLFWLVGFLVLSLRLLMGYVRLYRLKLNSKPIYGTPLQLLKQLQHKLKIRGKIGLVESALINMPGTIGYLKPIILMPLATTIHLTPAQLEAVLAHELAHIKRADFILNIFYSIIETIFYYHPAVWWIAEQMQHERESNCDDLAIQASGNKVNYLKTLFTLHSSSKPSELSMNLLGKKSSLYKRFNRQLITPERNTKTMEKMTTIIFLFIALAGLAFRNAENNLSEPKPAKILTEKILIHLVQDTVPNQKKMKSRIKTDIDGHRYEMLKENGKVIYFKKDGKEIAASKYHNHKAFEQLQEMLDNSPAPHTPPAPPAPQAAPTPPSPPAPPHPDPIPELVPAPKAPQAPSAPSSPQAAPAPPAPPKVNNVEDLNEREMLAQEELLHQQEVEIKHWEEVRSDQETELAIAMKKIQVEHEQLTRIAEQDLKKQQVELAVVTENLMREQEELAEVKSRKWEQHQKQLNEELIKQKEVLNKVTQELREMEKNQRLHLEDLNFEETKRILQDEMKALQIELEEVQKKSHPIRIE